MGPNNYVNTTFDASNRGKHPGTVKGVKKPDWAKESKGIQALINAAGVHKGMGSIRRIEASTLYLLAGGGGWHIPFLP